jgi:HlyD family secretion protein
MHDLKHPVLIAVAVLIILGAALSFYFLAGSSDPPAFVPAKAAYREIRVTVNTNGIIEPVNRTEIYAPIEGFVTSIPKKEGTEILQGQLLLKLDSEQVRSALAEANAALLAAKRQARVVETGPSKEEIAELDASIAETAMQLDQQDKDLAAEEALLAKQATTRAAVEALRKQRDLLQLRAESFRKRKQDLLARFSAEDKEWEQSRIAELTKEVDSLKRQLLAESIVSPGSGRIYSLQVKQGAYVNKGQLLAQIYQPGKVRLRTYVDEPDLGRVRNGQEVRIEWDGLPNEHWTGVVDKMAEQVVAMNNRSVGEVLCSIESGPPGLIPNLNVRVEIVTDLKQNALVVPRSAVFNPGGKPSVMVVHGENLTTQPVELGLFTPEEIEIVRGINAGDVVVLNPTEVGNK